MGEKIFQACSGLIQHQRTHKEDKPYKCQGCQESVNILSTLVKHKRIPTGEKPYKCQGCEKAPAELPADLLTPENPHRREAIQMVSVLTSHQRIILEEGTQGTDAASCLFICLECGTKYVANSKGNGGPRKENNSDLFPFLNLVFLNPDLLMPGCRIV